MRRTRAWLTVLVALIVATACDRGSPTSPSTGAASGTSWFRDCDVPTHGVMTATLDGTAWVPVSTNARGGRADVSLEASDCTYTLRISLRRFRGVGTYDVAAGDVSVDFRCDGRPCGIWQAGEAPTQFGIMRTVGSGSLTVTSFTAPTTPEPGRVTDSGKIEGTFAFTVDPYTLVAPVATGTKVIANGRFGSGFWGY